MSDLLRSIKDKLLTLPDETARDPHTLVFSGKDEIWFTMQWSNYVGRLNKKSREKFSETFDQIVKTIRERARLLGQVRTLTAQGKLQGIIVGVLPFLLAFVLYLIDPQLMMPMFTTPLGKFLIGIVIMSL